MLGKIHIYSKIGPTTAHSSFYHPVLQILKNEFQKDVKLCTSVLVGGNTEIQSQVCLILKSGLFILNYLVLIITTHR